MDKHKTQIFSISYGSTPIRQRVHEVLRKLERNPLANVRKLSGADLGEFRLRLGDWRILFDLDGNDVVILRVGHRKDIYRRKP